MTGYSNQAAADFNQTNCQLIKQWVERDDCNHRRGVGEVMCLQRGITLYFHTNNTEGGMSVYWDCMHIFFFFSRYVGLKVAWWSARLKCHLVFITLFSFIHVNCVFVWECLIILPQPISNKSRIRHASVLFIRIMNQERSSFQGVFRKSAYS